MPNWKKLIVSGSDANLNSLDTTANITVGGILKVANGTATVPSITFTNDIDTGIYTSAGNVFNITTGGVNRFQVDTSGITSAANVYSGTSGQFRNYAGVWKATTGQAGGDAQFILNGKTILHIDETDEYVGIGTTSPNSVLEINYNDSTAIANNGYAGLSIRNGNTSSGAGAQITFAHADSNSTGVIAKIGAINDSSTTDDNGILTFATRKIGVGMVRHMTIDSDGRVGIGTTSTTYKLDVNGDGRFNGLISGSDTYINGWNSVSASLATLTQNQTLNSGGTVNYVARFESADTITTGVIRDDGSAVGIGTAPGSKTLTVSGTGQFTGELFFSHFDQVGSNASRFRDDTILRFGTNRRFGIRYNSSDDEMQFVSSSVELIQIKPNGNVGIGASPEVKLDVRGQLLVAGDTPDARIGSTLEVYRSGSTAELSIHQDDSSASSTFSQLRFRNGGNDTYLKVPPSGNGLIIDLENQADALVMSTTGDTTFKGSIHLDNDSSQLQFGDDNDMQIFHNGANGEINNATGNFTIDSAGDITLDADGGDIRLYDGGVLYGNLANGAGHFQIKNPTQDMDISFIGNDGGSTVTALTLDMSEGGNATFAGDVTVEGTLTAQEFHTEFVSASIIYESGSTKFGDTSDDIHSFTGSIALTGSGITIKDPTTPSFNLVDETNDLSFKFRSANNYGYIDLDQGDNVGSSRLLLRTDGYPFLYGNQNHDVFIPSGSLTIGTESGTGKFNSYISATRQLTHNGNGGDLSIISDNNTAPVFYVKGTGTADLVNIFDDTTEVFTILDGGNVGIGTDSPGNLLDVRGDTDITGQLVVAHNANYVSKLVQQATSMSNNQYTLMVDSTSHTSNMSTAGAMSVDVNSGRAFTITGLGRIGIGTSSPGGALHVYNGGSERLLIDGDVKVAGATDLKITGTSRRLSFDAGTGTVRTSTANSLFLQTNSTAALTINSAQSIQFDSYGSGNKTGTLAYSLGVDSSGNIIEFTGGSGGSVSSITSGADNRVAVFNGSDSLEGDANFTYDGEKLLISGSANNSNIRLQIENANTGTGAYSMLAFQSDENHSVQPGLFLNGANNTNYAGASSLNMYQFGNFPLGFVTSNAIRMTVTGAGNVGIGTTTPGSLLDVYGDLHVGSGGNKARFKSDGTHTYVDAIPTDSHIVFRNDGSVEKMRLTDNGDLQVTGKVLDADIKVPNQNLLDIGSIKISNRNDIYSNATKTTIDEFKATYANDGSGASTIRVYVDDGILVDGDNYTVSVYYEGLVGTLSMDWCDTTLTGNHTSATGTTSSPTSGRIYGYASRSDYDSTYRFLDINLTSGASNTVTLFHPKVEAGTVVTDFVGTERTNQEGNSKDLNNLNVTGKVGIGTTSPAQKLHVDGNIRVGDSADIVYSNKFQALSNADTEVRSNNGYDLILNGNAGDNVGIGTTTPTSKLHVVGRVDFANDFRLRGTDSAADQGVVRFFVNSNNELTIDTSNNGNNLFVINESGQVGINTSSPSRTLDVNGEIQNNGIFRRSGNVIIKSTGSETMFGPGGSGIITFHNSATMTTGDETIRIDANGNLLLNNTSAGARLDIREDTNYAIRAEDASGHYFRVNTGGDVDMRGDLTVQGSITAQEFYTEFVSASIVFQSGSTKFGDTLDDNHDFTGSVNVSGSVHLTDNSTLKIGDASGGDLQVYHNGGHSLISNQTGDLFIRNQTNDGDIKFQADDGSGGDAEYFRIDGGVEKNIFSKPVGVLSPTTFTANTSADDLIVGDGTGTRGITIYSGDSNSGNIYFADDLDEEGAGDSPAGNRDGVIQYSHSTAGFNFKTGGNQQALSLKHTGATFKATVSGSDVYINDWGSVSASLATITGNDLDGSGTTSYVPKWSDSDTLTDSAIYDSSGNIIIGGTTPDDVGGTSKLSVDVGTGQGVGLRLQNGGTDGVYFRRITTGGAYQLQTTSGNSNTGTLSLQSYGGNVGIGTTSPNGKLHISGISQTGTNTAVRIENDTSNTKFLVNSVSGDYNLQFKNAGNTVKVLLDSNGNSYLNGGNVGIGDTGPLTKLHVKVADTAGTKSVYGKTLIEDTDAQLDLLSTSAGSWGSAINFIEAAGSSANTDVWSIARQTTGGTGDSSLRINFGTNNQHDNTYKFLLDTAGNITIPGGITVGDSNADTAQIGQKHLLGYCENTDVDTGTETVKELALSVYQAVFFDYVVKNGTNLRAGTVTAVHDGTNVEYTDTSTKDLGDTSAVTLSVDISGSNMRLRATTTSDNWIVKANIRGIKV